MSFKIELSEEPARPVLTIRAVTAVGNLPQILGRAFGEIIGYLTQLGEQPAAAPFVAYYNLDMENLDVEIGFPVLRTLPGQGEIQSSEIPGGRQVSTVFRGPYQELTGPYEAMAQWMQEQGLVPTGVSYEFYFNSPMEVPENELLTKIMFPVK